jgi:hypothetical protein
MARYFSLEGRIFLLSLIPGEDFFVKSTKWQIHQEDFSRGGFYRASGGWGGQDLKSGINPPRGEDLDSLSHPNDIARKQNQAITQKNSWKQKVIKIFFFMVQKQIFIKSKKKHFPKLATNLKYELKTYMQAL